MDETLYDFYLKAARSILLDELLVTVFLMGLTIIDPFTKYLKSFWQSYWGGKDFSGNFFWGLSPWDSVVLLSSIWVPISLLRFSLTYSVWADPLINCLYIGCGDCWAQNSCLHSSMTPITWVTRTVMDKIQSVLTAEPPWLKLAAKLYPKHKTLEIMHTC